MSLFLMTFTTLVFLFLCSTAFSGETKDSISLFLRGLAASLVALVAVYFFRNLIPNQPGHALCFLHAWFYDFFWYLAAGIGLFLLVPSYRDAYAERSRRLESFLFGVFAPSGLATLIQISFLRDPYYLFMLPVLRVAMILLMSRLIHRTIGEYGLRLGLLIAAATGLSALPAIVPFFHFWNLRIAALVSFAIVVGAAGFICRDEIAAIFHKELRAFREGRQ